jgi:hypothetical protein
MNRIQRRPRDVTEQLLEFAENGRLVILPEPAPIPRHRSRTTALVAFAAVVSAGIGVAAMLALTHGTQSTTLVVTGVASAVLGLVLLIVAASAVSERESRRAAVQVKPGAVLPPDLVHVGNWINRGDAWVRIEEIGRDGGGRVSALLSTDEIIFLDMPVTIAGGAFRPVADPVASLRH